MNTYKEYIQQLEHFLQGEKNKSRRFNAEVFIKLLIQLEDRGIPLKLQIQSILEELLVVLNLKNVKSLKISNKARKLLKYLKKEFGLIPKGHFASEWMVYGRSLIGLPF
ncbi:hypothetical protein [Xanthovirga aplysinae]|uniref:hypothetical protein n=1 Tax=Xanthovirga aplysinae TaxID=2529853 RepID=UPI0012BCAAD1|nr:hypothetical protein [Xanthovirga aplysinae]MTI33646.1 hypothetical protein [Xanthovirga aplysinae]